MAACTNKNLLLMSHFLRLESLCARFLIVVERRAGTNGLLLRRFAQNLDVGNQSQCPFIDID